MYNFEGKQPSKTLERLWEETHSELKFKVAAIEEGYKQDDVQKFYKKVYHASSPIQKRRLRKKRINDIVEALKDERTLGWIANRLFVSKQCVHQFYNAQVMGKKIVKDEKDKSPFKKKI